MRLPSTFVAALLPVLALLAASGCGGTRISGENRDLVVSLATAASARESSWLEKNAALLEERRAAGKVSDAEYAAFQEVVAKAKAGDWDAAQAAAYALRDSQEPTAEDLHRLSEHKLDHQPKTLTPKGKAARKP